MPKIRRKQINVSINIELKLKYLGKEKNVLYTCIFVIQNLHDLLEIQVISGSIEIWRTILNHLEANSLNDTLNDRQIKIFDFLNRKHSENKLN